MIKSILIRSISRKSWLMGILCFIAPVQLFAAHWITSIGQSGNDVAYALQQNPGGYYYLAGCDLGPWSGDPWIIRLDSEGTILWQKKFGLGENYWSPAFRTTFDGGILAVSTKLGEQIDLCALKIGANGESQWLKFYHSSVPNKSAAFFDFFPRSVQKTSDNCFIVAGKVYHVGGSMYYGFIFKLDANGNSLWQKQYGLSIFEPETMFYSIAQTPDEGFIIAGNTTVYGTCFTDVIVMKFDQAGTIQWQQEYQAEFDDDAEAVITTSDGGYIVCGSTTSFGSGSRDIWVLKLDAAGSTLWQKAYGSHRFEVGTAIIQTNDGGYTITGSVEFDGSFDTLLIHIDEYGSLLWQKRYNLPGADRAHSLETTSDGDYLIAGSINTPSTEEDFLQLKTDQSGNISDCYLITDLPMNDIRTQVKPTDIHRNQYDIPVTDSPLLIGGQDTSELQLIHCYGEAVVPTLASVAIVILLAGIGLLIQYRKKEYYP